MFNQILDTRKWTNTDAFDENLGIRDKREKSGYCFYYSYVMHLTASIRVGVSSRRQNNHAYEILRIEWIHGSSCHVQRR